MSKLLLIDGDQFVYKASAAVEQEARFDEELGDVVGGVPPIHVLFSSPERAKEAFEESIERLFERFGTREHVLCFTSNPNFRNQVDPSYKAHRKDTRKPLCFTLLREYATEKFNCKTFPGLEADDVMGILATKPGRGSNIIVSQDKDMKTIPATVWDGKDCTNYTEAEADYWHMFQTLVGDAADGYKGCPGVGPVKAEKILSTPSSEDYTTLWERVVRTYGKAGLTEADALVQARLARILRWDEWDRKKKEPILWTP